MLPFTDKLPAPLPDYINTVRPSSSEAKLMTIPSGGKVMRLRSGTAFWMKRPASSSITAAAPTSSGNADGEGSVRVEANSYYIADIEGVSLLSVLSTSGAADIYAEFWGKK